MLSDTPCHPVWRYSYHQSQSLLESRRTKKESFKILAWSGVFHPDYCRFLPHSSLTLFQLRCCQNAIFVGMCNNVLVSLPINLPSKILQPNKKQSMPLIFHLFILMLICALTSFNTIKKHVVSFPRNNQPFDLYDLLGFGLHFF